MLKNSQIDYLFDKDGHLSEEGIALWVDAMYYQRENDLPSKIREHVETCARCKSTVIEVNSVLGQQNQPVSKHPYFKNLNIQEKKSLKRNKYLWLKIAASIIILVSVIIVVLFQLSGTKDHSALFAEYFSPYPNIMTGRNDLQGTQNKIYVAAFDYYEKGEYKKAGQKFGQLYANNITPDTVLFYYGITSLITGDTHQAIELLSRLLSQNKSQFLPLAEWYLALAYLSEDKADQCKFYLKMIIEGNGRYKAKAAELYRKIK